MIDLIRRRFSVSTVLLMTAAAVASLSLAACGEKADSPKDAGKSAAKSDTASAAGHNQEFASAEKVEDPNQRYTLALHPTVGETFAYRITQQASQSFGPQKTSEEVVYNFSGKITGLNNDGSLTLEMRYDSVRIRRMMPKSMTDTAMMTVTFDSRRRADSSVPGSEQYRAIIGQNVSLTLAKNGDVREVSNLEPIISNMISLAGKKRDSIPPRGIEQLREALKVQAFATVVQQMFLQALPDSSVAVGGEWTKKNDVPIGGIPATSQVTYKLADVRKVDDRPIGHLDMKLLVNFPKKTFDNQAMSATITNANVDGSGDALYDLVNGFPVRKNSHIDIRLSLNGKMKVGPQAGKSESISQRLLTSALIERTQFTPAQAGK